MHESTLLQDMGLAILGAATTGLLAHLLRLPLLLAYIAAGVILGPHLGFGLIQDSTSISTIAEVGLVLLLFILGLEIDLRKLLQAGKAVLLNGLVQFAGGVALGLGFFALLGYRAGAGRYELVYLAVAASLSSTLVVVKILSDRLELDSLTSRITLGVLVIQDLWAITFLAVQPNLADLRVAMLLKSLGGVAILVGTAWTLARYVLSSLFKRAGKVPELMLILAIAWAAGMCGLAAALHLSKEMGALIAGVSIASFPYQTDVAAKVSSLRDFFITLFFVALGLQIPVPTLQVLGLASALLAFVWLSRWLTVFPLLRGLHYGNRAGLVVTVNLAQLSEFALVVGTLGVGYGHLKPDVLSAFIFAMIGAALVSALAIPRTHSLYKALNPWLERLGLPDRVSHAAKGDTLQDGHAPAKIVLLGFYHEASSLLHELMAKHSAHAQRDLMVVDFNPEAHHKLREMGIRCEYGDISHADTLKHLQLDKARLLVCTIPDHLFKGTNNLTLLKNLRKMAPQARIVVTAETLTSARLMYHEGADYVFLPRVISAHYLADVLQRISSGAGNAIKENAAAYVENRHEVLS